MKKKKKKNKKKKKKKSQNVKSTTVYTIKYVFRIDKNDFY